MDFLYPLLNFLQPGIFWPQLEPFKPMLIASVISVIGAMQAREQWSLVKSPAVLWATAFVLIQALSVYYSGLASMLSQLEFWYIYPVFMAISLLLIRSERSLRRYIWGMLIGSMFVVADGIYRKFSGLNSIRVAGEMYLWGRAGAYGMYTNWNDYSFIIIQIVPFIYVYWRRSEKVVARTFLIASLAACILGILLCQSRGGMLALALEGVLLPLFTMRRRTQLLLLPLVALIAVAGIEYQWKARAETMGSYYTYADSEGTRLELWHTARLMIQQKPLLGVGSGRFPEFARDYYDLSHDDVGKNAHNTYLDTAATSGLLGLGAFLMMLGSVFAALRTKFPGGTDGWVDATRAATFVALLSMMLRAFMDAKESDWSFYTLGAIAIASTALRSRCVPAATASGENAEAGGHSEEHPRPRLPQYPWAGVRSARGSARVQLRSRRS